MHVAIIGLGLIGGSIGLALKQADGFEGEVVGYVHRPEVSSTALRLGVVDKVETNLSDTVKGAELVVIATPVLTIKEILSQLADYLSPGCVVTDTASTKLQVVQWAKALLPPSVDFVGGHPMAGKETYGIQAAEAGLFRGCTYCLTSSEGASPRAIDRVADMVRRLGATPFVIDAQEHDDMVAGISHLPLLLSAALVSVTAKDISWHRMSKLAASGYRDLTRLASGNPEVNAHICLSNQKAIAWWIDKFNQELGKYCQLILAGDEKIEEVLAEANKARQEWLDKTR